MPKKFLSTDQDYIDMGLTPPEHIVHEGSDQVRPDNHKHEWYWPKRGGAFIECRRGHHVHGIPFNHLKERLVATDAHGRPVFAPIVLSNKIPIIEA